MEENRPDPEQLLRQVNEQTKSRGKLKIFFGACAGAGKTYAMLSSAQEEMRKKVDIVVGLVETHGRTETSRLLEGLTLLPLNQIEYHGITIKEFDLDAALIRKPRILLVDELAHTNAVGSRHPKRWQDIVELLDAGIDVFTTLNVQHIESLNDVIANLTGIRVKETVPDSIFDSADEIVLVDIPSEEILERLSEGKVYLGEFAKHRAAQHFFKIENLIALREIALRRTAERVDALRDIYKKYLPKDKTTAISEKILVCIGPKAISTKLVRTAKQQATRLKAPWTALYVENAAHANLNIDEQKFIEKNLRLAEQLGGQVKRKQEPRTAEAIANFAKENNYPRIIIGKSSKEKWKRKLWGSLVNDIIDRTDITDIYIINEDKSQDKIIKKAKTKSVWLYYLYAFITIALFTVLGLVTNPWLGSENMGMLYLVAIVMIAVRTERNISIFVTLLSCLFYKFFFTYPYLNLTTVRLNDLFSVLILLTTGIYVSIKAAHLHQQNIFARNREEFNDGLYELSRKLLLTAGKPKIAKVVSQHIGENFESAGTVWLPDPEGHLQLASHPDLEAELKEESVAKWAFQHNKEAGRGTNTMPSARGYYIPITNGETVFGVLGVIPKNPRREFTNEENMMLESYSIQTALALERVRNVELQETTKIKK